MVAGQDAAALERRLIQLRDNISGAHAELAKGEWRGLQQFVRDGLETQLRAWVAEQEDLRERKGELVLEPVSFGPLFSQHMERKGPPPVKTRWNKHDEYGGYAGCVPKSGGIK